MAQKKKVPESNKAKVIKNTPASEPEKKSVQHLKSKSGKGRYYKGHVSHKPSQWNKFQHILKQYKDEHPGLIDYKKYGGNGRFAGDIWKDVKNTPLKEIENNIDLLVDQELVKTKVRRISIEKFKKEYEQANWWIAQVDIFEKIKDNRHVIPGDIVVFQGEGLLNDFEFDIRNPEAWNQKARLIHVLLKRIEAKRKGHDSDDNLIIQLDQDIVVDKNENWHIVFNIAYETGDISDLLSEGIIALASDKELSELDIEAFEAETFEEQEKKYEEGKEEKAKKREEEKEKKELEKEEKAESEELKIIKAKVELAKSEEHKAEIDLERAKTEERKAELEIEKTKAETEKIKAEIELLKLRAKLGEKTKPESKPKTKAKTSLKVVKTPNKPKPKSVTKPKIVAKKKSETTARKSSKPKTATKKTFNTKAKPKKK
jgi:hypothetical protein